MLQKLAIKNYILIEDLEVDFSSGMNVITGETGAGKSIIIDAISLLMGERSSAPTPTQEGAKIVIEGTVIPSADLQSALKPLFERQDWDWEDSLILRREFSPQGKSRLFVNDTPVRLKDVQELSPLLIELHQQFDHLSIRSRSFQLQVLDAMADNLALVGEYKKLYQNWLRNTKLLQQKLEQQSASIKQRDYNQFMYDELAEADLQTDEIEQMDEQMRRMENNESILQSLQSAVFTLTEGEENIGNQIAQIYKNLSTHTKYLQKLEPLADRIKSIELEIKDISDSLHDLAEGVELSPAELELLSDRLSMANKLLTKHQLKTTEELLQLQSQLEQQLLEADGADGEIQKLTTLTRDQENQLKTLADQLSERRKSVVDTLQVRLHDVLSRIGMEKASVNIDVSDAELNAWGADEVQFYLDANQTGKYETLGAAASGGELNRIMLALKSIIAENVHMPTLIFDEIDSGISGEPARSVGQLMRQLAADHQVITITHQASIAAQGDKHWYIYKQPKPDSTGLATHIRSITDTERAEHIAELIGGKVGGESALAAAHKLLEDAR